MTDQPNNPESTAVKQSDFLLDIYYYKKELETTNDPEEQQLLQEKIDKAEMLYLKCRRWSDPEKD